MTKISNQYSLTNILTADLANSRLGINNVSPTVALDVTGAGKFSGVLTLGSTISNGTFAYTLPSATGTLALTSALSGTTNYHAKFISSTTIGDSLIFDNGTNLGIGTTTLSASTNYRALNINGTTGSEIYLKGSNVDYGYIYANSTAVVLATQTAIPLNLQTNAVTRLSIASTGAATFSSSDGEPIIINSTNATTLNISLKYNNGTQLGYIGTGQGLITGGGSTIFAIRSQNSTAFSVNGGDIAMTISSNRNVGIGTSSPSALLHIKGSGNYDGQVIIGNGTTTGGGVLSIHQNGVSSGFFSTRGGALGNSNRDLTFYTSPGLGIYTYTNEGTAGPYIVSGGTSWTSSSDERLKDIKNIIPNAIESILKLRAVVHTWKYDNENKEHLGLLAQDLQKVYPQVVVEDDDEIKTLGVNYTELIPVLVKAIQELSAEITLLKNK